MLNNLVIEKSYLAEINFSNAPNNGQRVYFLDIPELRGKVVKAVEAFSANELNISPNGKNIIGNTKGILLTLTDDSTENYYQWPAFSLEAAQNGGIIRTIKARKIDLTKSYVTIADATTIAQNQSVCFNFYYE